MRIGNVKQAIEKTSQQIADVGRTVEGLETTAEATGVGIQKLAEVLMNLSDKEKKQRIIKGGWLLTQALTRGNYSNLVILRDECAKQPPSARKKRVDEKRSYPSENQLALGVINASGIFRVTEELEPETEALYISRVMDLLDIWEARYLVDDGRGNVKVLEDDERRAIDETVFNDIDTAVYDPMQDRVQALWTQLQAKGHELDAGMKQWAQRPAGARQYINERQAAREERKDWKFGKRLKWALGFRKNLG